MSKKQRLIITAIAFVLIAVTCYAADLIIDTIVSLFPTPWGDVVAVILLFVIAVTCIHSLVGEIFGKQKGGQSDGED